VFGTYRGALTIVLRTRPNVVIFFFIIES
jgi:hypothetical protein